MNLLSGTQQDFHRPQRTPGGYEWWHFDGEDRKTGYSFSIQFFAGNPFSPYYQENLRAYWKKTRSPLVREGPVGAQDPPTVGPSARTLPSGPNPLDHCGVAFRVFHRGRLAGEALQEFPGRYLKASEKQGAVLLGPNRFNWDQGGDPPSYVLTAQAPLRTAQGLLRARLFFTPLLGEVLNLPQPKIRSTHTWVLAAPFCHVEGTLEWCDRAGEVRKEQAILGRGYHDHHFGSVPLERFVRSWHWGRAFLEDQALVYSVQTPAHPEDPPQGFLMTMDKNEIQTWSVAFQLSAKRRTFFWLPYEKNLGFLDSHSLEISHARVLNDGPAALLFEDQVTWDQNGRILEGPGLGQYLFPPRLGNRLFFPMLKGKTAIFQEKAENPLPPDPGDVTTTRPEKGNE